jgi:hypothetical protein
MDSEMIIWNNIEDIREIYRAVHNDPQPRIIKARKDKYGVWNVSIKDRRQHCLMGFVGSTNATPTFHVQILQVTIRQHHLGNIPAVFVDPRDATLAFHMITRLLKDLGYLEVGTIWVPSDDSHKLK